MSSALDHMVGGDHYHRGRMQPVQFVAANAWDPFLFSSLKYLTRFEFKGTPDADLQKSRHYIELREELLARPPIVQRVITMDDFIAAQGIRPGDHAAALLALEMYALRPEAESRAVLFSFIEKLKSGLTTL